MEGVFVVIVVVVAMGNGECIVDASGDWMVCRGELAVVLLLLLLLLL